VRLQSAHLPDLHTGIQVIEDVIFFQCAVTIVVEIHANLQLLNNWFSYLFNEPISQISVQCFDIVGWVTVRASGL